MLNLLLLREYVACTLWLESLKSKSTLTAYTTHLSLFCKFHNIDPDQLIQLNVTQIKIPILNYIIHLKKIAKHWSVKPTKEKLSVNSIKLYLFEFKSFLDSNGKS